MDITNTTKKPITVIAKHGDDLRQDMLTLQMLALMDKVRVQRAKVWSFVIFFVCVHVISRCGSRMGWTCTSYLMVAWQRGT